MASSNAPADEKSVRPGRPWVSHALVAVTLLMASANAALPRLAADLQLDAGNPSPWSVFSYAFVHAGWGHVLGNMLALGLMGGAINAVLGHAGFLALYLGGAAAAACAFLHLDGHQLAGASGAVCAVMGAYLVLRPRAAIAIPLGAKRLRLPAGYLLLVYFVLNVLLAVAPQLAAGPVAYEAHLAGMVFGGAVAFVLRLAGLVPPGPCDFLSLFGKRAG